MQDRTMMFRAATAILKADEASGLCTAENVVGRCAAGEQRDLIRELRAKLLEVLRADGGCDHSVGICVCGLVDLIKRAGVAIDMKHCRECHCTEDLACAGGCAWADVGAGEKPICTECAGEPRAQAPGEDNQ